MTVPVRQTRPREAATIGRRSLARGGVWLALVGVLALGACTPGSHSSFAAADSVADPYAAVRAQADEYYRQGQTAYQQGEYRKALDAFQRAKLHDPNPRPEIEDMIRRTNEALAGGQPANPTATIATATPAAAAATATSLAPPVANTFMSRAYSYVIAYPPGWRAEGATTRVGSTLLDLYAEDGEGGATAMVFGFSPSDGSSQEALIRQSLALRQKMGTPFKRLGVRSVDSAQAVMVAYTEQRPDGVWLTVRQAVFLRGGLAWVVAVAVPTTDAQRYTPVLDQMLDGFRLTGPTNA